MSKASQKSKINEDNKKHIWHVKQSVQESKNLWKTVIKKSEVIWSV